MNTAPPCNNNNFDLGSKLMIIINTMLVHVYVMGEPGDEATP